MNDNRSIVQFSKIIRIVEFLYYYLQTIVVSYYSCSIIRLYGVSIKDTAFRGIPMHISCAFLL